MTENVTASLASSAVTPSSVTRTGSRPMIPTSSRITNTGLIASSSDDVRMVLRERRIVTTQEPAGTGVPAGFLRFSVASPVARGNVKLLRRYIEQVIH